jgi:hypothetical protein
MALVALCIQQLHSQLHTDLQVVTYYHTLCSLQADTCALQIFPLQTYINQTDLRYNTPTNFFTIHRNQQCPYHSNSIKSLEETWLLAWHSSALSWAAHLYPMGQCWMGPPRSLKPGSGLVWNNLHVSTRMPSICINSKQNLLPSSLNHLPPISSLTHFKYFH